MSTTTPSNYEDPTSALEVHFRYEESINREYCTPASRRIHQILEVNLNHDTYQLRRPQRGSESEYPHEDHTDAIREHLRHRII
jgi:hypothetical protein